jgi:hypothetical protein
MEKGIMDNLKEALRLLETHLGEIDNVKFLLSDRVGMSKEQVIADLEKVAHAVAAGECEPIENFDEPGLSSISLA